MGDYASEKVAGSEVSEHNIILWFWEVSSHALIDIFNNSAKYFVQSSTNILKGIVTVIFSNTPSKDVNAQLKTN